MTIRVKAAEAADGAALLEVKQAVWPEEMASLSQVRQGLAQPGQLTLLALDGERPVGLATSFPTIAANGQRRWDLDLLAVCAEARGQRLGTRLVEASLSQLSRPAGELMRTLIATSNVPSQKAFQRAGYLVQAGVKGLFSAALAKNGSSSPEQIPAYLLPVQTLSYSGYWLEEIARPEALQMAARLPATKVAQIVGALLPVERPELVAAAEAAGYAHVGDFQHWQFIGK